MKESLAYIHPDAKIGKDVVIEPFAMIYGDVEIGDGTWIGPNVTIMDGARIGKNCKIFPGAVISAIPQDLKFKGEYTTTHLGDNTTIRECATVNRGTASKGKTVVGDNCLLMAYVHIGHDSFIGNNIIMSNSTQIAGEVIVDDFAIIAGACAVHQFVRIGAHTMINGGSMVTKDVPPYIRLRREGMSYAGLNSVGLRRRGFDADTLKEVQEIYRQIFLGDLNVTQACKQIRENMPETELRNEILDFIENSERGIIRKPGAND